MYFPNLDDDSSEMTLQFGKFRLNYVSEQPSLDYSIRVIECENLEVLIFFIVLFLKIIINNLINF
jgi:hypothetical protein